MAKKPTIHDKLDQILALLNRKSSNIFDGKSNAPQGFPTNPPPPTPIPIDPLALVPDPALRLKALNYRDQNGPLGTAYTPETITDAYREEMAKFKIDYPAYVTWAAAHPEIHA